ncbi:MAG: hypothetical protein EHM93_17925 [Bacteroidales bacterium]|nr:MAG: hypothetical protein EHM93_17925 [Bacteroidales bacterium]
MGNCKNSLVIRIALWVFAFIVLAFILYFTIMSLISTSRKIAEINDSYSFNQIEKTSIDEKFFTDSTFVEMQKERAFTQSRIAMAETDSIGLTLNLRDSLAQLEVNGVVVHKTKISFQRICKAFNRANSYAVASMLSKPLNIISDTATIKKVPLLVKMAPKDTSEYKPDAIPDTSSFEPVNYILEMSNGIRIFVYQQELAKSKDVYHQMLFDVADRAKSTLKAFKRMAAFEVPEYRLYIKIKIPKDDAKIIYRAIPRNGQITVFW